MGGIFLCYLAPTNPTKAQIVPDGTLPVNSVVTPGDNTTAIAGGTTAGGNLFHSFEQFSLPTGSEAYFNNAPSIQNIISRVTGGLESNIDGLIRANGSANVFLINPNGISFGPNARLSIGGSFVGSTASSVNFADGSQFSATAPQTTPLLTISVPVGLQFGRAAGSIRVQGLGNTLSVDPETYAVVRDENPVGLQVKPDKTLALVGGDVTLAGGNLIAESGRIELGSVAGSGLVSLTPIDSGWYLGYSGVPNFGNIDLSRRASVDTSSDQKASSESVGSGDIQLQGSRVTITDGSAIFALNLGALPGGAVAVNASDAVEVNGTSADGSFPSGVFTDTEGSGAAGDLTINTATLLIQKGAFVTSDTVSAGDAGDITVNASDAVQLIGTSANRRYFSRLSAATDDAGAGGNLTINTGQLQALDGAYVSIYTLKEGNAGSLTVNASDSVQLSGYAIALDGRLGSSALSAATYGTGAGGNLTINTPALQVLDGAYVSTATYGEGDAGSLTVNASDSVQLDGNTTTPDGQIASSFLSTETYYGNGAGGNLTINTPALQVLDGAYVSTATYGEGDAGSLTVNASDSVQLSGYAIASDGSLSSSTLSAATTGTGAGGNLTINTGQLLLQDVAQISTSTFYSSGNAGTLTVNASDEVKLIGESPDGQFSSGLFTSVVGGATGAGGNLILQTGRLIVQDGATISSASTEASGVAGNLELKTGSIRLDDGLIAATTDSGNGGNISVQAEDLLLLRDESKISASAGTAQAPGNGGNIRLESPSIIAVPGDNSDITANAYSGRGGDVQITAQGVFGLQPRTRQELQTLLRTDDPTQLNPVRLPSNDITAISRLDPSLSGLVTFNTPDIDPSQGLVELPTELADVTNQIVSSCAAGGESVASNQFVVTGRGGLPPNPREPLGGEAVLTNWATLGGSGEQGAGSRETSSTSTSSAATQMVEAQGWVINSKGEVVLTASAPTVTLDIPWLPSANCHAAKTSS